MTEQLPISINACDHLVHQFSKIKSACNKLEAQFNFQTMAANWYCDEDNILFVQLCIEAPENFALHKETESHQQMYEYSDDAFSYVEKSANKRNLICHIAITETELNMLDKQKKFLSGLLNIKLKKVLNLIAKQLMLDAI